jgi:hypothetical protein
MGVKRRGLRGKARRDADDRAVERTRAEQKRRETDVARIDDDLATHTDDIATLETFRTRTQGFAPAGDYAPRGHQHGFDDINSVNWGAIRNVPNFATNADLSDLRRWVSANFRKL